MQLRFFCEMFYSRLFIFLQHKCQSYYFVKLADYFSINSKYFKDFFQIFYLRKILSLSLWQLVTQLVHSSFGDNHLVFFYLWLTKIVIKCENVYKRSFQDCLKFSVFVLTSLKICGSFKNDQQQKLKNLYKCCAASIVTTFNTKFLLPAKIENSGSLDVSSAGFVVKHLP